MKNTLIGFVLGVFISAGFGVLAQEKGASNLFAVAYTISEKCYECPYRYLMVCSEKDCNVPNKTRIEYAMFNSLEKARRYASGKPEFEGSSAGLGMIRVGEWVPIPTLATDIKIYELVEVKP